MAQRLVSEVIGDQKMLVASLDMTVRDAVQWMVNENCAAVLVERDGNLVGIFTENDALSRVLAEGRDAVLTRLHDVMTRNPVTLTPDRPLIEALSVMRQFGFRHVPVVVDGRPLGLVSLRDFLELDMVRLEQSASR